MVPRWVKLSNLSTNYVFDTDKQAQRCTNEGHGCITNKWESTNVGRAHTNEDQGSTNTWMRARAVQMRAGQHENMNNDQVSVKRAWTKARTAWTGLPHQRDNLTVWDSHFSLSSFIFASDHFAQPLGLLLFITEIVCTAAGAWASHAQRFWDRKSVV